MTNRKLHRWLGFGAAILFLYVAATGVILQVQQLFGAEETQKEALAELTSPVSLGQPLQASSALDRARVVVLRRFGNRSVDSIDWQIKGPSPFFTFHLGGADPLRVQVEVAQARIISVTSDEEDFFIRLHSGEIIGDGGKVLGLGWGIGLLLMVVTGFIVYLQMYRARQQKVRTRGKGLTRFFWSLAAGAILIPLVPSPARAQSSAPPDPSAETDAALKSDGLHFNPDAGLVFTSGDFKLTTWGFVERVIDPDGPDYFRRLRQGMEFDLPRLSDHIRPALFYEVDLTNTNFFGDFGGKGGKLGRRNLENLFVSLQHPDDPGKFRALLGENTHILSREDNLSSGNLPTISRSLILEEHGSVHNFGSQFGFEFQKALSDRLTVQLAALDNRGSFNADRPRYSVGNSLSGKIIASPAEGLTLGAAVDHTRNIGDQFFTLATAIGAAPLGGVVASGDKLTFEADAAYTWQLLGRPITLEGEVIRSAFSRSNSDVFGGYLQGQFSLFDASAIGDLDLFARYDLVSLGQDSIRGRAQQGALRTGVNYNLPHTNKLVNLHAEYAHNSISGPAAIVTDRRPGDEFRIMVRASLTRYLRH